MLDLINGQDSAAGAAAEAAAAEDPNRNIIYQILVIIRLPRLVGLILVRTPVTIRVWVYEPTLGSL
jgi:hypothetical protein